MKSTDKNSRNRWKENKGFYCALGICVIAIAAAAWSTYDSIVQMGSFSTASSAAEGNASVAYPDISSAPELTSSALPQSSAPASSAAAQESSVPESSQAQPAAAKAYTVSDSMVRPVKGELAAPYSEQVTYSKTMRDWRVHSGADYAAQSGETAYACANGLVKEVYTDALFGNTVVIEHGDCLVYYCGLGENFIVNVGDTVTQGQPVGSITACPCEAAEETHLHLGVQMGGKWVDPETLFG